MKTRRDEQIKADLCCTFCGKDQKEVKHLIVGPGPHAYICNECIDLCNKVIAGINASKVAEPLPEPARITTARNPLKIRARPRNRRKPR